jgi:protease-4
MKQFFKYVMATIVGIIVISVIGFVLLFGMLAAIGSASESNVKVKENSVYQLDLKGTLVDRHEENPLVELMAPVYGFDMESSIGLDDILANIKKAKENAAIKGIYLNAGRLSGGFASIKEIRDALLDFKASGKFIVAYGDNYTQRVYYLCSVADKILMNPIGILDWKGLGGYVPFIKGTLDKLGIEMQVVRVGTFKSAVEPYVQTQMSEANRLQTQTYINSTWNTVLRAVSETRGISTEELTLYADKNMAFLPVDSILNTRLIDGTIYKDKVDSVINHYLNRSDSTEVTYISNNKMNRVSSVKKFAKDKIAVLYAVGEIGETPNSSINGKLMEDIQKISKNKNIKAVVFRVNSPGGDAYLSEQILHAVTELKAQKPVVVSMGDYAASGGYYISCNADYVVAQPNTITGSIGVFGVFPNIKGLSDKIGMTFDGVKTNKMSDCISLLRTFSPDERNLVQGYVNRIYELFTQRCADGRNLPVDSIKAVAEGRVWTGEDALKKCLVDELGGLPRAIEKAAELADIEDYTVRDYPEKESFEVKIMKAISGDIETKIIKSYLGENYNIINKIKSVEKWNVIQARMEEDIIIR